MRCIWGMFKHATVKTLYRRPNSLNFLFHLNISRFSFTIENDMLTPTQKYRRNKLVQKYEVQLRALYTQLDEPCMDGERW